MKKIKFVIWGAGQRGKILFDFVGKERVTAFVDERAEKQGSLYMDKPVISYEEYKRGRKEDYLVLSMHVDENLAIQRLQQDGISLYFRMSELPSEMQGYGISDFWPYIDPLLRKNDVIYLWGDNLYTLLVYEYCVEQLQKETFIISESELLYIGKDYRIIETQKTNSVSCVYATSRDKSIDELANLFVCEVIDIYDMSDYIPEYYYASIEKYHNCHFMKRCFIVATGPSLKIDDLKILQNHNELCMGVNRIFYVTPDIWTPTYYVCHDRARKIEDQKEIAEYPVRVKFLGDTFDTEEPVFGEIEYSHVVTGDSYNELPSFSTNIAQKIYAHATVTYCAIQIAVYMGFKEIYLLGVDCQYNKGNKANYFVPDKKDNVKDHYEDRMIMCYKAAKKYAETHDIKIYNATRGGMLEVFERVDFDNLFPRKDI